MRKVLACSFVGVVVFGGVASQERCKRLGAQAPG